MLSKSLQSVLTVLLLSGFVLLSGCGFQLRGNIETPAELQRTHITGVAEYSELYQALRKVLQRSGTQLIKKPEEATSIIHISNEGFKKRVLSVDSQGRAAEYELQYRFTFTITSADREMVPEQKIELTRDFRFDPNNVLAKDAEEGQIRKEMIGFAIRQMMRRIQSHLKHT